MQECTQASFAVLTLTALLVVTQVNASLMLLLGSASSELCSKLTLLKALLALINSNAEQ